MQDILDARYGWAEKVGQVFNLMPRNGRDSNTFWLQRLRIEKSLGDLFAFTGVHICLDGPSGTGKTSLIVTMLNQYRKKYVPIQVTQHMTWSEFCKHLVTPPANSESSFVAEAEGGWSGVLPTGKFRGSLGQKRNINDQLNYTLQLAASWTESDVSQALVKEGLILFIDDFEKANPEIVIRVSDMCKLLTQSYVRSGVKLVIVGTDDIYRRIMDANKSLRNRVEEVSVGTFHRPEESWKLLQMGFEKLGLKHPAQLRDKPQENIECMEAIYEAANGLPKSLNELGREISLQGFERKRVSAYDIKSIALEVPKKNYSTYRKDFPKIIKLIEENQASRAILQYFYRNGIGQIHSWSELVNQLRDDYTETSLEESIGQFIDCDFLTKTGLNSDVIYVKDTCLAHNLYTVSKDPLRYGQAVKSFEPFQKGFFDD